MGIRVPRISISADYGEESALGDINTLSIGYGIHQAWIYAAMFGTGTIFGAPTISATTQTPVTPVFFISIAVYAVCLLIAGFTDRKVLHFCVSKKTLVFAALLTSIGTLAALAAGASGMVGLVATLFAGVATGVGSALLLLFWGTAFSRHESASIVVNTGVALVVAIFIYSLVLHQLPYPVAGILTACLPLAEMVLLWKLTPIPYTERHEVPIFTQLNIKRGIFALRFCIPVFIFGYALGSLRETSIQGVLPSTNISDQMVMLLAAGIATVLILITVFALGKAGRWSFLFRPLIPFIAVAVFLLPFSGGESLALADLVLLVAYLCFEALMWIFFGELSQGLRLSPVFVFGLGRGSLGIGALVGSTVSLNTDFLTVLPFGDSGAAIVILLAMVIAYSLLPREKDIREIVLPASQLARDEVARINAMGFDKIEAGVATEFGQGALASADTASGFTSGAANSNATHAEELADQDAKPKGGGLFKVRCEAVADHYLLSRRETEVMFLLAKGHNSAFIQERLFISEGTAKTHIRHIYKKLDIHNQQDLLRIVDDQRVD